MKWPRLRVAFVIVLYLLYIAVVCRRNSCASGVNKAGKCLRQHFVNSLETSAIGDMPTSTFRTLMKQRSLFLIEAHKNTNLSITTFPNNTNEHKPKTKMKFTATVIAASVVAVSAFTPATTFVRSTALQGHVLAGYKPIAPAAAPAGSTGGIPGFSGFGHATGQATAAATPAPAPVVKAEPIFSGFGHATGQMGGNLSLIGKSYVSPSPAVAAPAPAPAGPVFSGFGHATGQMGGNPSIMAAASSAPAKKAPASSASYLSSL